MNLGFVTYKLKNQLVVPRIELDVVETLQVGGCPGGSAFNVKGGERQSFVVLVNNPALNFCPF